MRDETEGRGWLFSSVVIESEGRILLVREAKAVARGQWNLPGGHLRADELPADGARREAVEETGVTVELTSLLGVYAEPSRVRYVYRAAPIAGAPAPGDEILEVKWWEPTAIVATPDEQLVRAAQLRDIAEDVLADRGYSLSAVRERA